MRPGYWFRVVRTAYHLSQDIRWFASCQDSPRQHLRGLSHFWTATPPRQIRTEPRSVGAMSSDTLEYEDTQAEIHKVVVGPMDNNVYVLRCKESGDAVL